MYGINQIIAMQDEASVEASSEKLQPLVAEVDQDEGIFQCPNFGFYRPDGWVEVATFFVDNSGFGSESEPALTPQQFIGKVREGYGYAVTEAGQFQVHITEFERA